MNNMCKTFFSVFLFLNLKERVDYQNLPTLLQGFILPFFIAGLLSYNVVCVLPVQSFRWAGDSPVSGHSHIRVGLVFLRLARFWKNSQLSPVSSQRSELRLHIV